MVQEVLEQIKAAEDAVEEHRQQAKMNCRLYEEQKQERLAELRQESEEAVEKVLTDSLATQEKMLQLEKEQLLDETKRTEQALHERYEANKEQVIDSIIERGERRLWQLVKWKMTIIAAAEKKQQFYKPFKACKLSK